ncbi:MAG: tetratricopeptide repeat protein [Verrucomicrobiae bacterium]|nr:tetratricopeptide repeat protein [Verrucomicrobiae bacterium]
MGCARPADGGPKNDRQLAADPTFAQWSRAADTGDFSAASVAARELVCRFPKNGSAWNCMGWAAERLGVASDAEQAYRKAVEVNPRHAKAWANLGLMLGKRGAFEEEIRCYRRSLKLRPRHAATWMNLAAVAQQAGRKADLEEALRNLATFSRRPPPAAGPPRPAPAPSILALPPAATPSALLEKKAEPVTAEVPPRVENNVSSASTPPLRTPLPPKPPESVEDFLRVLRERPQDASLWNNLGVAQAASGDLEASLASFREARWLASARNEPRWNVTRAAALLAEKDFQEGRSAQGLARLHEAAEASPESDDLRVALVKLDLAMGNLDTALADAAAMSRESVAAGGAWLALGLALFRGGREAEALVALVVATECLPNQPAAWQALGAVQARRGKLVEAAASLARATKLDPSNGEALYQQGLVEIFRKNWRTAARFLRSAARRLPTEEVFDAAFAAEEKEGGAAALAEVCRETLARDPANAAAWRTLARLSEKARDGPAAVEAWRRAAALRPSDPEGWNRLGVALAREGHSAEARAAFEQGLATAPEDSVLLGNLTLALWRLGEERDAESAFVRLRKADPARARAIASWRKAAEKRSRL